MIAVILAGGRGTRIAEINADVPKPMIPILGKPILQYQLESLRDQGIGDFIFVIGYKGDVIREYFRDGAEFGVRITYYTEETPLGTAGALFLLKDRLRDDFLLLCGDLLFDIDVDRFYRAHVGHHALGTLFTHPNSHPYDSSVIVADREGRITDWLHKDDPRGWYRNRVNAGLHFLSPRIFDHFDKSGKVDLDKEILKPLIPTGELYVYDSPEYVKDMGTPDRYWAVIEDIRNGKMAKRNLKRKQKAIFLDRDGTINRYVGFLRKIDAFELMPGVGEAVRKINESDYLAIVVTNQPVIARGEVTEEELDEIHRKMETLLARDGAYLDAIYYCPHHPDKGFPGERAEYKIVCTCRKPKIGMLTEAAERFNIDLGQSWMVGDGEHDLLCGKNAGCKTAMLGHDERADICGEDLLACVSKILEGEKE